MDFSSSPTAVDPKGPRPVPTGPPPTTSPKRSQNPFPPVSDDDTLPSRPPITRTSVETPTELAPTPEPPKSWPPSTSPFSTPSVISPGASSSSTSKAINSSSSLDKTKLASAGGPSGCKSTPTSTPASISFTPGPSGLAPTPQITSPDVGSTSCQSESFPVPPTSTTTPPASMSTTPKRTFAAVAKRVIIQERIRKAEEQDAEDEDEEPEEEDLTLEQLEEKAKSGDARAQTRLGQHYLILAEEKEAELNNLLGVNWLIKAAKQGRRGAARLLQRCWIQKKGITPENEPDVRKLGTESRFELAVRKAAMMMYWKLNPDRKQKVNVAEMLENVSHVNAVQGGVTSRNPGPTTDQTQKVLQSMVSSKSKQLVDLDDFVEITKNYAQGIVPSSAQNGSSQEKPEAQWDVAQSRSDETDLGPAVGRKAHKSSWALGQPGMMLATKRSGAMKRAMDMKSQLMVLQYPLHAILEMKEHLVDWASRAGVLWLSTIIPTQHVNALIFFFIISNLTIDLFAFVIPLLVFYLSFISMIICTLRVFQSSKAWDNFSALTALLTHFEPGLDVEQAETNFGWNNLEPYLYFIFSVFFAIFSFPVADKGWIPCSELSTVAIFFTAVSYMSLSPTAATYARQAMVIEVASSLCDLTRFLPETMAVARLFGHAFATLPLGESVVLNLSLPCLLYAYLFFLFFSMARMRGFRGTYCILVPYLVCFMWCEFSVVLLQSSSVVGLIRTCVAYFLLLFALPVLALGLAVMLLIQVFKWLVELELTKVVVTLAVCAIPVTLRLWTRFSTSILDVFHSLTKRGAVKVILFCVSMVILFFTTYVYHTEGLKVYNSTMTWGKYGQLCGPSAWQTKGMAQTQIFCSHMEGHRITWTGRFKHVRVAETENGAQSVINMLPVFMGDWLRCLYGETYPKCEPKNATVTENLTTNLTGNLTTSPTISPPALPVMLQMQEEELCQLKAVAKHTCHVKQFDSFRFEVTVGMVQDNVAGEDDPGRDILLMASHEFKQVLLNLEPGNMVEFSTKLEGRLGAKAPAFELKAIHCLDCTSSHLTGGRQVKIERNWRRNTLQAIKFAFDFFFSPFLSARIHV